MFLSFAGSGPDSRTTEIFIVMPDAPRHQLEAFGTNSWETPFGSVGDAEGLEIVGDLYSYGDMPPWGSGPESQRIYAEGYEYLAKDFPELDYIDTCRVVPAEEAAVRADQTANSEL